MHGVFVAPELLDAEGRGPVVVAEEGHGRMAPFAVAGVFPEQFGDDRVMAVGEHIGLDGHVVAHGPLDRIAAAIDLGTDRLDDDPRRCGFLFGVAIQA